LDTQSSRPLSDAERAILWHILSAPAPGTSELRSQISAATVSKHWEPVGSPSVDISVPAETPLAHVADGPIPIAAQVIGTGGDYLGELLVWVTGGRISALEYSWVTDEPPTRLPDPSQIQLSVQAAAPEPGSGR
jgi:hypothetical protein